jgi:hypothetical protein
MPPVNDILAHQIIRSFHGSPAETRRSLPPGPPTWVSMAATRLLSFRVPPFAPLAFIQRATRRFAAPEPACCAPA